MANPASRLARLRSWYDKQYQLEQNRMHLCMEQFLRAGRELELHREQTLAQRTEAIQAATFQAGDLATLASFRHRAQERETALIKTRSQREQALARQRIVTQKAQTRLRLVEKLTERRVTEYNYQIDRELETMASEMYLAGVARAMNTPD